jgi:sugar lactone lactonase YvrE
MADDAPALQEAIDQVAADGRFGVLFIPRGTYRLGRTVYVWPGVRLIGHGAERPRFVLGESTPGFQDEEGKNMLFFSGGRGREKGDPPRDGNPGTFYSALSNIDIEIREGNPGAVAIRFHVAQHCFLSHMHLHLGSAKAGLEDIGNLVEDLHFHGGQYGIVTRRSAPGWPILAMDCTFQDQRIAAIRSDESGLAMIRPRFTRVPTAISMVAGKPDQLWVSDASLEHVAGPAFVIGMESNALTQVNLDNVTCHDVPTLVEFRESGRKLTPSEPSYVVDGFSHGLTLREDGDLREMKTTLSYQPLSHPAPPHASNLPALPPGESWMNVHSLGAVGDGVHDDTRALTEAIAKHRTLYLPLGVYRVSDTLRLRPDTVLVGLHPGATAIYLPDNTPAFQDANTPKAVIEAPRGGSNILSGLGIYASALNPGAIAVHWMAGEFSMVDDVRLHGGHGTRLPGGIGDSWGRDHRDRWNSQPPSLWVTAGGGGVFKNIWTPSPYAKAGMLISDTTTPGRVYAMSLEHHVSNEMILRNSSNWRFHAVQFEEEREESPHALPLQIENCTQLLLANTFFYRVVSSFVPQTHAIEIRDSKDIRFRNTHVYSNSKVNFDNSVSNRSTGMALRDMEFAVLDVNGTAASVTNPARPSVVAPGAQVEKLADGFFNISGAAVDARGNVYFADPRKHKVYRWSVSSHRIDMAREIPERPEQLAFDQSGNLLIVAYEGNGTVLTLNPDDPDGEVRKIEPEPAEIRRGMVPVLPVSRWTGVDGFRSDSLLRKPYHYLSPDGTTYIPAGTDFTTGAVSWGTKLADVLRTFGLAPARDGRRFYVSNEAAQQTWSFLVGPDGTLSDPRLFVEEGGEGLAVDRLGRVYLAAGQVRVFDGAGRLIDVIRVPERPTCLVFGDADRTTLFITARSSLYGVRIRPVP